MPTALLINGAEIHQPVATGKLNSLLFKTAKEALSSSHAVLTTEVLKDYDVAAEQGKFQQADLVIFQTPIFWFGLPSTLKKYIDDVYTYGVFFGPATHYGRGGLLTGKRYMLSTTWNASEADFNDKQSVIGNLTPDELLRAFHLTQEYVGMSQLASFSEHDVVRNPNPGGAVQRLRQHLDRHITRQAKD